MLDILQQLHSLVGDDAGRCQAGKPSSMTNEDRKQVSDVLIKLARSHPQDLGVLSSTAQILLSGEFPLEVIVDSGLLIMVLDILGSLIAEGCQKIVKKIFVANLASDVHEEALKEHMQQVGMTYSNLIASGLFLKLSYSHHSFYF